MQSQLLFRVVDESGNEFRIYTDGKVEGFGNHARVYNYHPPIVRGLVTSALRQRECLSKTDPRPAPSLETLAEPDIQRQHSGK